MDEPSAERIKRTISRPSDIPVTAVARCAGESTGDDGAAPASWGGILARVDAPHPVTDASPRRGPLHVLTRAGADDAEAGAPPHGTSLLVHGSFFLASCGPCGWTGSARRARHTALRDAVRHRGACPGTAERLSDLPRSR